MDKLNIKNTTKNFLINDSRNIADLIGMSRLNPILSQIDAYLPFTASSLRPIVLATIINDIHINKRQNILELGSGISTILISSFIKKSGIEGVFVSIEEDKDWCLFIQEIIDREGLSNYVQLINAPVNINEEGKWYELGFIDILTKNNILLDCVVVDGPQAYKKENELIRGDMAKYIFPHLADKCSIFLDDVNRKGERKIMDEWSHTYGKSFDIYYDTLGVSLNGTHYNISVL